MTKTLLCLISLVALAGVVFGASPVAAISSPGTFELRGTAVNTAGVPSWPVLAGDSIATTGSAAVIRFADGTRVTLGEKSRAKVEKTEDGLVFRLISGAMNFTLASESAVSFYNVSAAVPATPGVATSAVASTGLTTGTFKPNRALPPPPPPGSLSSK